MVKHFCQKYFRQFSLFSILLLTASCGSDPNLAKVRDFALQANQAQQNLPAIAKDFYPSCLRAARYFAVDILPSNESGNLSTVTSIRIQELSQQIAELESRLTLNPALSSEVEQLNEVKAKLERLLQADSNSSISPEPNFLQERVEAQEACNKTRTFSSSTTPQIRSRYLGSLMETGNLVIVNYMKKIGELAGADLVNFDDQFSTLQTSTTNLQSELSDLFEEAKTEQTVITERVNAGLDIANFIVTQIFEGRRRETLTEAITVANEPLKTYAEGLQTVVKRVYIDQYLKTEEEYLDQYFIEYISAILDSKERQQGESVVAIAELLIAIDQDRWNPEKDKIQQRRELGYSYIDLLQTIVNSHQQLADIYNNGEQPTEQTLQKLMNDNNQALQKFIEKANSVKNLEKNTSY